MDSVYVISDLHLGGRSADDEHVGFQLLPQRSRDALTAFIDYIGREGRTTDSVELVLNGDFVDFLAEQDDKGTFGAFTPTEEVATTKLESAFGRAPEVIRALKRFVEAGHALTLLLGNHDLELSLPRVRRRLRDLLDPSRTGPIEMIMDGEAYAGRGFLIEHGNRYDGWNIVDHGALRAFRAALSRGEQAKFEAPAGSQLVVGVMNPLKERYRFVDLMKPENEGVLPILMALEPASRSAIAKVAKLYLAAAHREPTAGQPPKNERYVAAVGAPIKDEESLRRTREAITLFDDARARAQTEHVRAAAEGNWLDTARARWSQLDVIVRGADMDRLAKAMHFNALAIKNAYALDYEEDRYLRAAQRLAKGRSVILGHTHLAKFIALRDGGAYVNTGTWCPTIRLADAVDLESGGVNQERLVELVRDLDDNVLERWLSFEWHAARVRYGERMSTELLRWDGKERLSVVGGTHGN